MPIVSKCCIDRKFLIVAITINAKTKLCIIWVYKPPSKEIDLFLKKILECLEQMKLDEKTIMESDPDIDFMKNGLKS